MFLKLSAVALALFAVNVSEAQTNSVRLAVVPFFAPPGNGDIQQIAASAPDLLMVELSHDNRFQLVEREKVNAIWGELNLAESGFVSAETIEKFGRILSCDWLVSGSVVQTETSTQIWVKVIDVQSGVVLDLQEFPYGATNFSATISAISDFVAQINPRSQPRQFIALGNFADMSISSTRADLSHRLPTLIEKHFLAAGFGVVEREAVASIFSEFQLEWAGLIEDSTNRVKLKPAFWIMDGECKWVYDTQDKISVAMRVKKVGGGEQIFRFTKPPGDELDKAVLEAVQSALANTNQIALDEAEIQESKLLDAHAKELANGRGMTWVPSRYTTNVPPPVVFTVHDQNGRKMTFTNQSQDRPVYENAYYQNGMRDMLNTLKQAILLNTNDMNAKYRLGFYLVHSADPVEKQQGGDLLKEVAASSDESAKFLMGKALLSAYPDATQKQQGMDLLKEVAASSDATNAADAKLWLTSFEQTGHGPVWHPPGVSVQAMMTNLAISFAQDIEITNIADKAGSFVQIPSPPATGYFEGITAVKFWQGKVLIASGTTLQSYDSETESTVEIKLPLKLEHRITAIEADENDLWLGTEGGGLVRISKAGGVPLVFSEKDGFPMPSITALRLMQGRLLIGFGFHESGAFGYLDTVTEKFTGLMSEVSAFKSRQDAVQNPPETSIGAINVVGETNIWVSSGRALQCFDFGSKEWNLALPDAPGDIQNVSLNSSFMAAMVPFRCVAISKQPGNQWAYVNLSTDYDQNLASSLALDKTEPNLLWIGHNHGKVTILDMATSKIIGECKLDSLGEVKWIFDNSDSMIFLVSDLVYGNYDLYCLKKSGHSETNQETASSGGQAETGQKTAHSGGQITEDKWAEAMQEYFPKFVPVQFQKDENGRAILQQLHIKENAFGSPGNYYCGFRFTAPSWNDGDFECVYALIKTEAEKDFFFSRFLGDHLGTWAIITGRCCPFPS